jgi:hypothetical protein
VDLYVSASYTIEGSLEFKPFTIWTTNEAAEVGRVREEKRRKRSEKRKEEERGSEERKGQ